MFKTWKWPPTTANLALSILLLLFWFGILRHIDLPGIYMDAANPDYLVARTLNRGLDNPIWIFPTCLFPILGQLYHGVQNYYFGLPVCALLGMNVVSLRLAQAAFGAVIVLLLYLICVRATDSRLLSFCAAAGLATDIAFLSSFRTQYYIILGGETWLFASLYLLFAGESYTSQNKRFFLFFSGVCSGLAVYGYFVFLFFLPAMLLLASGNNRKQSKALLTSFSVGFVVGMLPYVVGYVSLIAKVGGIGAALQTIGVALHNYKPLSSNLTFFGALVYPVKMARVAMTNIGNEAMIFRQASGGIWPEIRVAAFSAIFLFGLILLLFRPKLRSKESLLALLLVILPCSYLLAAALFGNRLGAHHFIVLTPLSYLLCGVIIGKIASLARNQAGGKAGFYFWWVGLAAAAVLVTANLWQQNAFFTRLEQTGGVGKASNALTTLAEGALSSQRDAFYVFPEWGFFMSFAFLTKNEVPYGIGCATEDIQSYMKRSGEIRIAFWELKDQDKYISILRKAGIHSPELIPFFQRDGNAAFYLLRGKSQTVTQRQSK